MLYSNSTDGKVSVCCCGVKCIEHGPVFRRVLRPTQKPISTEYQGF